MRSICSFHSLSLLDLLLQFSVTHLTIAICSFLFLLPELVFHSLPQKHDPQSLSLAFFHKKCPEIESLCSRFKLKKLQLQNCVQRYVEDLKREHSQMLGPLKEMIDDEKNNDFIRWFKTKLMYLGSIANTRKRLVKPRFLPPGSLYRGHVQSLKTSYREQAPIKETQVDQTPIEAFEARPHAEVATKENLDNILGELEKNHSMSQFELVEKCFDRQDRDCVICFGLGMKPKDADLKAQLEKKNQHISELESQLNSIEHLETDHQKKIDDMQAAHKKDIEELQGEIKHKSIILRHLIIGVANRGTIVDSLTEEELVVVYFFWVADVFHC
ncbi:hypothetical protein Cgig2_007775 [Carnegiea gigantea]|uniref:Uncharacterized protein n=1 Tax=Carnegiea gigantea TaxID=171969 RepID=A0A9Q1JMA0_9CARY|nr:hypothetical protein Cgig2_007775 [Carnegiea gigantea]